jgi:Ser/Thr protein kinase RdoA (MazF antagonist)
MRSWRHPNQRCAPDLPAELRRAPVPDRVRDWIGRQAGSPVVTSRRLAGASSTAVHAIRLADGTAVVLRRYVREKFRIEEPDAPVREIEALDYARRNRLPVPEVIAADPSGVELGDGVPTLLMTRIPGRAHGAPDVHALAALAAEVHAVSGSGFDHRYFPWCRETSTAPPRASRRPELWEQALQIWRSAEPVYRPCFIHRDFHPGNVLWSRGALTGVVDWANACAGAAGIDVATCRWNLQEWAGEEAATSFVAAYEKLTGRPHHPYWDVAKIVEDDWDLIETPHRVWAAENLLAQALPRLAAIT